MKTTKTNLELNETQSAGSLKNSFVTQAAVLAGAGIIVRFIGFLYRWPLTALIGDEGNDIYSSGYLLYTFFLILSSAGLPAGISKMVSERVSLGEIKNANLVFKVSLVSAGSIGLLTAVLVGIFAKSFSVFVNSPDSYLSVLVLAPTIFFVSIMSVFRGYFQGMKNTVPTAVSQIIEQVFNAVFSVLLAYLLLDRGLDYAAAGGNAGTSIGAITGLAALIFVYFMYAPLIRKKMRTDNSAITEAKSRIAIELAKTAFPIIIGTAIFSMTNLIDLKMTKSLLTASGAFSPKEVSQLYGQLTGKYVVITTMPVSIATAMATAIVPNIAASVSVGDKRQVDVKMRTALKLTMFIAIPAAAGIAMLGDQILLMLFPGYPEGGILLQVGSISIIFLSLAQITTGILQGIGKVKTPAVAAAFGALVKIPLNVFLISNPSINVVGAVISTIACYVVASAIDMTVLFRATQHKLDFIGVFLKPLIASGVMALACYVMYNVLFIFTGRNTISCLCSIVGGIIMYVFAMFLINGFSEEDFRYIPMGSKIASRLYK